ncbi:STAS domain-containing protein [Saccharopolyspora griseoalba]|uniref:STAS domain-containing protein n=1 Tax=Saccharopolyspora griseoalba TaxID=1431848 RepID=A0ABW2LQT4_9PSEU
MANSDRIGATGRDRAVPFPRKDAARSIAAPGSLRIRVARPGGGVLVVQAVGDLDAAGQHFLAEPVRQRLVGTASRVVLDLSQISFINTDGVGVLLEACQRAESRGKDLVLISSPVVDRLLGLLGLAGRFRYARGPEEAAGGAHPAGASQ